MPGPVLDYSASPTRARHLTARALLQRYDTSGRLKAAGVLGIGAVSSFIGPAILAAFARMILFRFEYFGGPSWLLMFNLAWIILTPLLLFAEWRTRGQFLMDEMRAQGYGGDLSTGSRGEWELRANTAFAAFFIEAMLFAPRLIISAVSQLRARSALGKVDLDRAAELLLRLLLTGESVETDSLRKPSESADSFRVALRFLHFYDWIDLGQKGDRVWMLTTARETLSAAVAAAR